MEIIMSNYILSGCSVADLSIEDFEKRNINCIYYHYTLGGTEYIDDMGKSLSHKEFYRRMLAGEDTKTWQINSMQFCDEFRPILEKGLDIVHVTLSSGLSGVYNSAVMAAEMLKEEFPERNIYIVDSLGASTGYGVILEKMAELRDNGMSAKDLADWAKENVLRLHYEFTSTDLTFYIKGGRISKTSGMVGTLLGICPLMDMDNVGKLVPRKKVRTKKKVINEIVSLMEQRADNGLMYNDQCFICHSDDIEDAEYMKKLVLDKFVNVKEIPIYSIGTVIGSHSGPGTLALFYWGEKRVD